MRLEVRPARSGLRGTVRPPGDKSISHRAAMFGGLAEGVTRIHGFLEAEDTQATLNAMAALGAEVRRDGSVVEIKSVALKPPKEALDLGNAGTGIRLLTGALAGHPALLGSTLTLTGDASLRSRPMGRIIEPLERMGASIGSSEGRAPLCIHARPLHSADHHLDVASAQVKSAILLAGLNATGTTTVIEPGPSRDHSERLLPAFGVEPRCEGREISVSGPVRLSGAEVHVPGDLSSAAFMIAAAVLVEDSEVTVGPVGMNPTRDGFIRVLAEMAGDAVNHQASSDSGAGLEPVATINARAATELRGIDVPLDWVPLAIDEFPVIMAMAAVGEGVTRIRGAAELRVKESDRLDMMSKQLGQLGVRVEQYADGADVYGGRVSGGHVDAGGDHRIAMSLAVLALVAEGPVSIDGAEWIRTSYPGFVDDLANLGAEVFWS